jgi:hypothetical protein
MAPTGARFRVWLRFLAISDLVAVGWLRPVGSTPLESFIRPIRDRAESGRTSLLGDRRYGKAAWQVKEGWSESRCNRGTSTAESACSGD